ncbi:MAG: hypothetical protein OEU76_08080, partial [Cyclobacteriaceae bacterium]|nr:hypothetical protein [Cyclobacteriaceae bacterium]
MTNRFIILPLVILIISCSGKKEQAAVEQPVDTLRYPQEKYFKNMRQLTFGGDNAEAYWSFDNTMLTFQSNNKAWGVNCDQIFYTTVGKDNLMNNKPVMLSNGLGRTTCSYFMPDNSSVLFASTYLGGNDCPEEPERVPGGKYLWPIFPSYDIFISDLNGNNL